MKTTKRQLRQIIHEVLLLEQSSVGKIYHVTNVPISSLSPRPMWFWMDEQLGHIMYDGDKEEGLDPYLYEASVSGNIADLDDQRVEDLLEQNGVEYYDSDMASNPTEEEVLAHEGTKVLLANGYDGVMFWDYHPADSQQDAKSLMIFNTANSVSGWAQIR